MKLNKLFNFNPRPAVVNALSVDLIKYGNYGVFVYEHDDIYANWDAAQKRRSIEEFTPPKGLKYSHANRDIIFCLVNAISCMAHNMAVLDVGGHWGLFSLDALGMLHERSEPYSVICFEPGPTYELIKATIELNGIQERMTVRNVAVSDRTGPTLFYRADGKSQANALFRHTHHQYASLARCVDIRDIMLELSGFDGFMIKLDVEGLESKIVKAFTQYFSQVPIGMMIEIAHSGNLVPQMELMELVDSTHILYDSRSRQEIPRSNIKNIVDRLKDMPSSFTDIVCVPRYDFVVSKFNSLWHDVNFAAVGTGT